MMGSRHSRSAAALSAAVVLFTAAPALAGGSETRWDGDARSEVRIIAAGKRTDGALRAGVELRLKPGWITYWRYPGDAGIPPRFHFEGSENVKAVAVSWPAPTRLEKGGVVSIGYHDSVAFPLSITRENPAKPAILRMKLDYGVCEKLCVPAEAKLELLIDGTSGPHEATLAAADASVPKHAALGAHDALAIRAVRREAEGAKQRVVVDIAAPEGAEVDLFAEGPNADWALPLPEPVKEAPKGIRRFAFELDGAPPGATYHGAMLKLTATAGGQAIEVAARLD